MEELSIKCGKVTDSFEVYLYEKIRRVKNKS